LTAAQQRKVEQLARRFGCWPNDVTTTQRGVLLDVTIGVRKDRRKDFTLTEHGRVLAATQVRAR
jgi:hypothetical protein